MTQKERFGELKRYVGAEVLGQPLLVDRLLIALLCAGTCWWRAHRGWRKPAP